MHVGIILDGNRRAAKKLMLKPWKGHELGAKKIEKLFEWCKELGVKELTLYTFSVKNFNRTKKEVDFLMNLFYKEFTRIKDDPKLKGVKVNFIGRLYMCPKKVQKAMKELVDKTKNNKKYIINFAMAYGGREEIVDAAKIISKQVKQGKLNINKITKEIFGNYMYMNDNVDLIIRTSGEKRTSDFLPWQGHYAEWIFLDKHWPEFEKEDFVKCIEGYSNRQRRFGK